MNSIENVTTGCDLLLALAQIKEAGSIQARLAVRTDDSQAVFLQGVTLAWWLADGEDGRPLEYEGPFKTRKEAQKALEEWNARDADCEYYDKRPEPTIIQIILLDSEAV